MGTRFGVGADGATAGGDVGCGCAVTLASAGFWGLAGWSDMNGGKTEGDRVVFAGGGEEETGGDTPTEAGGDCVLVVFLGASVPLVGTIVADAEADAGFSFFASGIGGSIGVTVFTPVAGAAGFGLDLFVPGPLGELSH